MQGAACPLGMSYRYHLYSIVENCRRLQIPVGDHLAHVLFLRKACKISRLAAHDLGRLNAIGGIARVHNQPGLGDDARIIVI